MALNSYLSIITPNVNGLNSNQKTESNRLDLKKKKDPLIWYFQETHFRSKDTSRLKVREWRIIYHANGHQKKAGVAILISDKLDYKLKTVIRDEEGNSIIIKGSIQQEDLTISPNLVAAK